MKKNISIVMFGNVVVFISKIIIWLLLPKMMLIEDYGRYKEFAMYLTYVMFLHLGFPDGVLLTYAGRKKIDKENLRKLTWFFICLQIVIFALFFVAFHHAFGRIILLLALDGAIVNIGTYYKFISQASLQFKDQAFRDCFQGVFQSLILFVLYYVHINKNIIITSDVWICVIILTDFLLLLFFVIKYHDITFCEISELKIDRDFIFDIMSKGILLTLAFQISHLLFVVDRQMVDVFFNIDSYASYSFAYSLTGVIASLATAISIVLFPTLKSIGENNAVLSYASNVNSMLKCIFFVSGLSYFLCDMICIILPKYAISIKYVIAIVPGVAISSAINMIIFNYYKLLDGLKEYSLIALIMLVIGTMLNYVFKTIYNDPISLSFASIIVLVLWFYILEKRLSITREIDRSNGMQYIIEMTITFYVLGYLGIETWLKTIIYYVIFTFFIIFPNRIFAIRRNNKI